MPKLPNCTKGNLVKSPSPLPPRSFVTERGPHPSQNHQIPIIIHAMLPYHTMPCHDAIMGMGMSHERWDPQHTVSDWRRIPPFLPWAKRQRERYRRYIPRTPVSHVTHRKYLLTVGDRFSLQPRGTKKSPLTVANPPSHIQDLLFLPFCNFPCVRLGLGVNPMDKPLVTRIMFCECLYGNEFVAFALRLEPFGCPWNIVERYSF